MTDEMVEAHLDTDVQVVLGNVMMVKTMDKNKKLVESLLFRWKNEKGASSWAQENLL